MGMSSAGNGFGTGFGTGGGFNFDRSAGGAANGLFDMLDQLRGSFERSFTTPGPRMGRGDVRTAVLALLAEEPMHGYQIIREIEQRSGGSWKPSPGSVYPTLQLLADEGLISVEESDGRKTYSITDAGREEADASAEKAPWESSGKREHKGGALPQAGVKLAQAAAQVAKNGTPEQAEQAVKVLDDARRKLYSILAQE